MGQLNSKVALVTGGGRGLGRACAQLFAREGASVVVADINAGAGKETARMIRERGGSAEFVCTDVSKAGDVQSMVRGAVERYGALDCAVNNAVVNVGRFPLAELSEEDWNRSLSVNLTGVFLCMKYEIEAMLPRKRGAIVNIGSGDEHVTMPQLSWYLPAKAAIYSMTRVAALDYAAQGIRINAVGPGPMRTPSMGEEQSKDSSHIQTLEALTAMGRLGDPTEVAAAVVWLCTDAASYVQGHALVADGGFVL